jgi:ABC-2 type transport system ATP-binding protein
MKLVVKDIKKRFGQKEVLRGLNFKFEEGKIYALLGRNGAGKTTFFNCLNNDIEMDSGEYFFEDNDGKRVDIIDSDFGYVLSTPVVPDFLTAREFLRFFLEINIDKIKDLKDENYYFDLVHIKEEDRDKLLKDYSHGMKNKMQMLVNIVSNSKILLLDEPLTSLDVVVAEEMKELLKSIKNDRILIFSTHIMELATTLCDDIVLLNHGVLEEIKKENLSNDELKNKIIDALKEE